MVGFTRRIPLEGVKNFRDLGGLPTTDGRETRWGRLFRSGHLADLSDDTGMEMLARDIETVIDFRSEAEKKRMPVHWTSMWQPRYVAIPVGGNAAAWVHELMTKLSEAEFPGAELRAQFIKAFEAMPIAHVADFKLFFQQLIEADEGALLFHCTAGKDRTGIAAALLQAALGVTDEAIMENFLLTNKAVDLQATAIHRAAMLSEQAGRDIAPTDIYPLIGVEEAFLEAMWGAIRQNYASIEAYLSDGLGLDDAKRRILRERYLL